MEAEDRRLFGAHEYAEIRSPRLWCGITGFSYPKSPVQSGADDDSNGSIGNTTCAYEDRYDLWDKRENWSG